MTDTGLIVLDGVEQENHKQIDYHININIDIPHNEYENAKDINVNIDVNINDKNNDYSYHYRVIGNDSDFSPLIKFHEKFIHIRKLCCVIPLI